MFIIIMSIKNHICSFNSHFTEKSEIKTCNLSHITFDPSIHPLFHIKATEIDVTGS